MTIHTLPPPPAEPLPYDRPDKARMVPRPGSKGCFVNAEFEHLQAGGRAGQLRLPAKPPSALKPQDWPARSFLASWSRPTRWSRPSVIQDHRWPLVAQAPQILHVVPTAEGFDIENRRDEWRLNLMGRSRWQHPPIATGGRCSSVVNGRCCRKCGACRSAARWHAKRVEAPSLRDQYSKQLSASDIRSTEIPNPHWRILKGLKIPEGRDARLAHFKMHGHPLSAFTEVPKCRAGRCSCRREPVREARPVWQCEILSDRDTGYRSGPDWTCWTDFNRPSTGYRKLPDFGSPDRKGVAVGYLNSPFFSGPDWTGAPLLHADWRGTPLLGNDWEHGGENDKGAAAVRRDEREFARSLRDRAVKTANVDFSEPESEADDGAVAAYAGLEAAQMALWAEAEADEVRRLAIEEAEGRFDDEGLKLFVMTLDGRKQEKIAEETGMSQSAVSRRLLKIRNTLAEGA